MPAKQLKTMAENMGLSSAQAEEAWSKAKSSAKEQGLTEGSDRFYEYTMGTTKKIMQNMKKSSAAEKLIAVAHTYGVIAAKLRKRAETITLERDEATGRFMKTKADK